MLEASNTNTTGGNAGRFSFWLMASALGVTALTLGAVHAPSRIKLLGLFPLGYGLLAGLWMGRLARAVQVPCPKWAALIAVVLAAAGMLGVAWMSHRVFAEAITRQYVLDPQLRLAGETGFVGVHRARAGLAELLRESQQQRAEKLAELTSFSAYLRKRTAGPKGNGPGWPHPWPWVLMMAEVLLASTAAACLMLQQATHPIDGKGSVR